MAHKKLAFSYFGGKYRHLNFILPKLPVKGIRRYCEPFAGSAAVLLNRPITPIEILNDLDGEIVNFFRVLRDQGDELIRLLSLTPYARAEILPSVEPELERARRFFFRVVAGRNSLSRATPGQFRLCLNSIRRGMPIPVSAWLSRVEGLPAVVGRLRRVIIECRDATRLIKELNSEDTLLYCDPPYSGKGQGKLYPVNTDLTEFWEVLPTLKAKIAVSGYKNDWIPPKSWFTYEDAPKQVKLVHDMRYMRQEVLWTNYDADAIV